MKKKNREHLLSLTKDNFEFQAFRGGGPGGQHQNKNDTAMRCFHRPSGAVGECREFKSQHQNKQRAFKRCCEHPKFKMWLNRKSHEVMEKMTLEEKVEKMMHPDNVKTEVRVDGKWVDEEELNEREDIDIQGV